MGGVVSLRAVRRQRARAQAREAADAKVAVAAVPKARRALDAALAEKARRDLDAKKRE